MIAATVMSATPNDGQANGSTDGLAIALRGLRKSYGSHVALAGLDLSVPSGVVYGFLGPNGAGKTTTMRLLTGLIHPDAGSIELLGRAFVRGDRRRLFDVGALIETPSFYPYLSGRENLRGLAATGAPVPPARIAELLELVGLAERAGDAVSTYSLGMKQRLGIASALLSDPTLLLLDEPANGLDPAGIVALRDTLKQLAGSGKTVFVSSHILGEVRELADVVGIIAAGRLVREGPLETLLQEGGAVRVRFMKADVSQARIVLAGLAGTDAVSAAGATASDETDGPVWLSVQLPHERAAEVNRVLAEAGIFASGLETESTLEALFLELTGGHATGGREGTFQGVSTAKATGGSGEPGGPGEGGA